MSISHMSASLCEGEANSQASVRQRSSLLWCEALGKHQKGGFVCPSVACLQCPARTFWLFCFEGETEGGAKKNTRKASCQ